jgi:hypothetical protein
MPHKEVEPRLARKASPLFLSVAANSEVSTINAFDMHVLSCTGPCGYLGYMLRARL